MHDLSRPPADPDHRELRTKAAYAEWVAAFRSWSSSKSTRESHQLAAAERDAWDAYVAARSMWMATDVNACLTWLEEHR
jgi:hypothetical protein